MHASAVPKIKFNDLNTIHILQEEDYSGPKAASRPDSKGPVIHCVCRPAETKHGYQLEDIGAMDETPIWLDMVARCGKVVQGVGK